MINLLLQYPLFYRLYQKTVRKKNHEYDLFKFIFSEIHKRNQIRMLDLCSGDSFILKYVGEYLTDYIGVDNNEKYLKSLKSEWPDFKFINADISKLDELREIENFKPNLIFMNGAIHHLNDKTMKSINDFNCKFKNSIFLSVDPNISSNSLIFLIIVGTNAGPSCVGPINAAPISVIPCGKKDKSFSLVKTPGLTILSAIFFLPKD